jgi:hypothetical protein
MAKQSLQLRALYGKLTLALPPLVLLFWKGEIIQLFILYKYTA